MSPSRAPRTATGHRFDPSILRAYDIRGVMGVTLFPADARALGRALAKRATENRVAVIGYDGRHSSPAMADALRQGLVDSGMRTLWIGLVPTPCLYFATQRERAALGIMVTGSHNAPDYNGFKITLHGRPFYGADIQALAPLAAQDDGAIPPGGGTQSLEMLEAYVERLLEGTVWGRALNIAWDPGNGATGVATEQLTQRLPGVQTILNGAIDGSFPNHHPDPVVDANLAQLQETVRRQRCDFGVAFDGDGDRIAAVDERGRIVRGDQLLAILARDVLARHPGAAVLADVKASQGLFEEIRRLGGRPVLCSTGHSIIKTRMLETGAPLAGEMSGHIFFGDRYFGFDDALYAAVRLATFLSQSTDSLADIVDSLPRWVNTPEIRIEVDDAHKFDLIAALRQGLENDGARFDTIDGVRVETPEGWWLARASNTQNVLSLRCEGRSATALCRLQEDLRARLGAVGVHFTPMVIADAAARDGTP